MLCSPSQCVCACVYHAVQSITIWNELISADAELNEYFRNVDLAVTMLVRKCRSAAQGCSRYHEALQTAAAHVRCVQHPLLNSQPSHSQRVQYKQRSTRVLQRSTSVLLTSFALPSSHVLPHALSAAFDTAMT